MLFLWSLIIFCMSQRHWMLLIQAEECTSNSTVLQERLFEDLVDLRNKAHGFLPEKPIYNGMSVAFKMVNITVIPRNAFATNNSRTIRRILLNNKKVHSMKDGAFIQLECLLELNLTNNNISTLTKDVLKGLDNLQRLDMSNNSLKELPEGIFLHVPHLLKLYLVNNKLQVLKPGTFAQLWSLRELFLTNNRITEVMDGALQYFKRLYYLDLGSNRIDYMRLDKWTNADELNVLNLADNALANFDTSVKYSFHETLVELHLGKNNLTTLSTKQFRERFPNLLHLDINDNAWNCTELLRIVKDFKLYGVSHHGSAKWKPNINGIACDRIEEMIGNNPTLRKNLYGAEF